MAEAKKIKTALISVFHKDGLDELLAKLNADGVKFLSTGGTQKFIEEQGYACQKVEDLTTYPSILGGRVKTLHPKVFGGILARRDNVMERKYRQRDISLGVEHFASLRELRGDIPLPAAPRSRTSSRRSTSAASRSSAPLPRISRTSSSSPPRPNTACSLTSSPARVPRPPASSAACWPPAPSASAHTMTQQSTNGLGQIIDKR